jgi:uncharacterized protein (TIGR00255 family)
MLYSMTGYGRIEHPIGDKNFLIEIRSLNCKQLELQIKLAPCLKTYEADIRTMIAEKLFRGSVECSIFLKQNGGVVKPVILNTGLIKAYYEQLTVLAKELKVDMPNVLGSILQLSDVITPTAEILVDVEWESLKQAIGKALELLCKHREQEGKILEKDLVQRIHNILSQQAAVALLAPERKQRVKSNLIKLLEEHVGKESYDANRLEQELIYYIEKIDITEEQVRLKAHCDYFMLAIAENEISKGKKLSFILQEIGREINTTGAKANDATMQKCVVIMKDELEKAKEQLSNIL